MPKAFCRRFGVSLEILLFCMLFLSGCTTEYNIATKKQDLILYSTEREVRIGKSIVKQVEKEYELVDDPLIQKRLQDIGDKIVAVSDRKDIDYEFKAIEEDEVNAFALPGGFIYVNSGLIDKVESDDELACVLAHEVGHVVAKHSIKKLQAVMGYMIFRIALTQTSASEVGKGADTAFGHILLGYSRDDELLADRLAVSYAEKAGYSPGVMVDFLERLREINLKKPPKKKTYLRSHPYIADRIRTVKQELGISISFEDYINRDIELP